MRRTTQKRRRHYPPLPLMVMGMQPQYEEPEEEKPLPDEIRPLRIVGKGVDERVCLWVRRGTSVAETLQQSQSVMRCLLTRGASISRTHLLYAIVDYTPSAPCERRHLHLVDWDLEAGLLLDPNSRVHSLLLIDSTVELDRLTLP